MERFYVLNRYQKFILILLALMVVGFIVPYATTVSRVGYSYQDAILVPAEENGSTLYSGKIDGQAAVFTVRDNTVSFRHGNKTYGPYAVQEDETAIPKGKNGIGVEVRQGDQLLFRGSAYKNRSWWLLTNENGTSYNSNNVIITSVNGIVTDKSGNIIDPMEPSVATILDLLNGPELTHKGSWWGWFGGTILCVLIGISILFADDLFYWQLSFSINRAYEAEPSEWEIGSRYIAWTIMPLVALYLFFQGLR